MQSVCRRKRSKSLLYHVARKSLDNLRRFKQRCGCQLPQIAYITHSAVAYLIRLLYVAFKVHWLAILVHWVIVFKFYFSKQSNNTQSLMWTRALIKSKSWVGSHLATPVSDFFIYICLTSVPDLDARSDTGYLVVIPLYYSASLCECVTKPIFTFCFSCNFTSLFLRLMVMLAGCYPCKFNSFTSFNSSFFWVSGFSPY